MVRGLTRGGADGASILWTGAVLEWEPVCQLSRPKPLPGIGRCRPALVHDLTPPLEDHPLTRPRSPARHASSTWFAAGRMRSEVRALQEVKGAWCCVAPSCACYLSPRPSMLKTRQAACADAKPPSTRPRLSRFPKHATHCPCCPPYRTLSTSWKTRELRIATMDHMRGPAMCAKVSRRSRGEEGTQKIWRAARMLPA